MLQCCVYALIITLTSVCYMNSVNVCYDNVNVATTASVTSLCWYEALASVHVRACKFWLSERLCAFPAVRYVRLKLRVFFFSFFFQM